LDINDVQWKDADLFAMAARQMPRVLIDAAREHRNHNRGGHFQKASLSNRVLKK
jgi:hypothetical protein